MPERHDVSSLEEIDSGGEIANVILAGLQLHHLPAVSGEQRVASGARGRRQKPHAADDGRRGVVSQIDGFGVFLNSRCGSSFPDTVRVVGLAADRAGPALMDEEHPTAAATGERRVTSDSC